MIRNFLAWAEAQPEAPALAGRGWAVGYGALARGVLARAARLHRFGVRQGDTVALSLEPDSAQMLRQVELFYALDYLGATILPLYPESPAARRAEIVARFAPRWLISTAAGETASGPTRIDPDGIDAIRSEGHEAAPACSDDPARPFLYDFSSGTTGPPKAVRFSAAQFEARTWTNNYPYAWLTSDRVMPAVQWPSKVGVRLLLMTHSVGAAFVNERFPESRARLAELTGEFGVTCINCSPWQLRRLLASTVPAGIPVPGLRFMATGGSFISPRDIRAAREEITPNAYVVYACTEAGKIACLPPGDPADATFAPVPGFEIEAVDETDRPLPPGMTGRLRVRAAWIPRGYAGDDAAGADRFRDGWFYPGDLASIDAAGRITLLGRSDDVINFGGLKIVPARVEQVLLDHPDVAQAALVGMPDRMAGEIPVAFVVLRRRVALDALREHCATRLDVGESPCEFWVIPQMPRNPEGKIVRERLREICAAARAQQAARA